MAEFVVDASVVVKWYIPEQNHEQARALRDAYLNGTHDLLAPALMPFEAVNVLRYSGQYDGDRLVDASETLPEYGVELVAYRTLPSIAEIATELDVTIYDAAYLALAAETESLVYTADGTLLDDIAHTEYAADATHIRDFS